MIAVKKLKKMLEKYDDNYVVALSSDSEGNGYSFLCEIEDNAVFNSSGEYIGIRELTSDLIDRGFSDEDLADKKSSNKNAIILYP